MSAAADPLAGSPAASAPTSSSNSIATFAAAAASAAPPPPSALPPPAAFVPPFGADTGKRTSAGPLAVLLAVAGMVPFIGGPEHCGPGCPTPAAVAAVALHG